MYCIATLTSILQRQQTPIHVSVENGFQESVEVLLAGGADLNCREKVYLSIFVYLDIVGHHHKNTGCFMIIRCHIYITRNIWIALVTVLTEKIRSGYIKSHEYISPDQKIKLSKDDNRRWIVRYKFHFQLLQKCLPVLTEDSLCTRYQIYIYIYHYIQIGKLNDCAI